MSAVLPTYYTDLYNKKLMRLRLITCTINDLMNRMLVSIHYLAK